MKQYILTLLNHFLGKYLSYNLVHKNLVLGSHIEVWKKIKSAGMIPDAIFDIGAAKGNWTRELLNLFPEASYLLFDPLQENELALDILSKSFQKVMHYCCALGKNEGELEFYVHANQSSKFSSEWGGEKRKVPLRTLDSFITEDNLHKNSFMKIDVQGAELEVLAGASKILNSCKVIQVEISFRKVYDDAPLAHEVIKYFAEKGFRIFDIVEANRRNHDRSLLQADIFFVSDNDLFKPETWS
ncbi:MAG: hypothetical protein COB01_08305 [Lutibacter sp.]|nr:MAG: hypothetical protein COB01_08305 [Lutibacter sp.]